MSVTIAYDDYRRALDRVRDLPAQTAAELGDARQAQDRAGLLAERAVATAQLTADDATKAIEAQLAAARTVLELVDKPNLIPPHIRPSGGPKTATRDDIASAQQALAAGVNTVRQVVQAEIKRIGLEAAERLRAARAAADAAARTAAARARRRRLIKIAVFTAVPTAILIVILILVL